MQQLIPSLLSQHGIFLCAPISLSHCRITRGYLLERAGITTGTAWMFAVPYYTTECDNPARNISAYAVSGDYHRFFAGLFDEILPVLRKRFPTNTFVGFTDHSPLAEAEAAVNAGLGFWGCNHLFLTDRYSSYVFLGEIITDAMVETPVHEPKICNACGACQKACPVQLSVERCLSALTQKKGELSKAEQELLLQQGCAWGCDICQENCPVTQRAKTQGSIYTTIPYFQNTALPHLTAKEIAAMSDDDFTERAYSWRGRAVILRNLDILEKGEST